MWIKAAIVACVPGPIRTRSLRPVSSSGMNASNDRPPTARVSTTGETMAARRGRAAAGEAAVIGVRDGVRTGFSGILTPMRSEMMGRFSQALLAAALMGAGTTAQSLAAQSTTPAPSKYEFLVGGGLGFGSSGIHQTQRGDSKPGEYLVGRLGLARYGRPFLVADVDWQPYGAPAANPSGTPPGQAKTEFSAVSLLAGVAIFPVADLYLMPGSGVQYRDWTGTAGSATRVVHRLDVGSLPSASPSRRRRCSGQFVVEGPTARRTGAGIRRWRTGASGAARPRARSRTVRPPAPLSAAGACLQPPPHPHGRVRSSASFAVLITIAILPVFDCVAGACPRFRPGGGRAPDDRHHSRDPASWAGNNP
jgi:hypothetical protein